MEAGELSPSLVALDDIKRIMPVLKACKSGTVTLSRIGDLLTVVIGASSTTFTLLDGTFPSTAHLLEAVEAEPVAIEGIGFNPSLFADYAKIVGKHGMVKVRFGGENKPIRVGLTGDKVEWRALLMPMRSTD